MGNQVEMAVTDLIDALVTKYGAETFDVANNDWLYEKLVQFYTNAYVDGKNES